MTEKRFTVEEWDIWDYADSMLVIFKDGEFINNKDVVDLLNEQHEDNMLLIDDSEKYRKLAIQFDNCNKELVSENALLEKENEQLKQQLQIFEKFLEVNNLSIDWDEFCGVDECAFENPDFSCKECIHLKGDVE